AAVWQFFRRRLSDRARAEELAQEVFVVLLRNAARYEIRPKARSRRDEVHRADGDTPVTLPLSRTANTPNRPRWRAFMVGEPYIRRRIGEGDSGGPGAPSRSAGFSGRAGYREIANVRNHGMAVLIAVSQARKNQRYGLDSRT